MTDQGRFPPIGKPLASGWSHFRSTWTHPDIPYVIRHRPAGAGAVETYEVRSGSGELVAIRWTLEAAQSYAEDRWGSADKIPTKNRME